MEKHQLHFLAIKSIRRAERAYLVDFYYNAIIGDLLPT